MRTVEGPCCNLTSSLGLEGLDTIEIIAALVVVETLKLDTYRPEFGV
jgi:hypothetical protein